MGRPDSIKPNNLTESNSRDGSDSRRKKSPKKTSRSIRLRKYESGYKLCMDKINTNTSIISEKKPRTNVSVTREQYSKRSLPTTSVSRKQDKILEEEVTPKRPLNNYQKFLQTESKREKYKTKSPKSRMSAIASSWKKKNEKKLV
jgi:hypothetical protein